MKPHWVGPLFRPLALLTLAFLLLFPFASCEAKTLHVSSLGDGTDGATWDTAFQSISEALTHSASGDTLLLRAETFSENIVLASPVTIFGGFTPDGNGVLVEKTPLRTIIDGLQEDSVIRMTTSARFERLHILNGRAPQGGGIYVKDGDLSCTDCIISYCAALAPSSRLGDGGGMYAEDSVLSLINCRVEHNTAGQFISGQGGGKGVGGGIFCDDCSINLDMCCITNNNAHDGFRSAGSASSVIPGSGGGMLVQGSEGQILNTIFRDNKRDSVVTKGVNIWVTSVEGNGLKLLNCSIISQFPRSIYSNESQSSSPKPTFINCIIRGNDKPITSVLQDQNLETVTATYCNIQGGYPGVGNIDVDPMFVDPNNDDYRLLAGSSCIDNGTTVEVATDFDGNPRPVDVLDVGLEGPGAFDIGAFEFQLPRSDLSGDGVFDPMDLFVLQADWMKAKEASGR